MGQYRVIDCSQPAVSKEPEVIVPKPTTDVTVWVAIGVVGANILVTILSLIERLGGFK